MPDAFSFVAKITVFSAVEF